MHLSLAHLAKVNNISSLEYSLTICKLAPSKVQMLLSHGPKSRQEGLWESMPLAAACCVLRARFCKRAQSWFSFVEGKVELN